MRDVKLLLCCLSVWVGLVSCQNETTSNTTTPLASTTPQPPSTTTTFPTQAPAQLLAYVKSYLDHWLERISPTTTTTQRPTGGGQGWVYRPPIVPGSHSDQRTLTRQQYLPIGNGGRRGSQYNNVYK